MEQLKSYADDRLIVGCIHCGGLTESRDHIPSRILLDEPYPENLPVVPACNSCNGGYSMDEQYFACLVECARTGSVDSAERSKIKRVLRDNPRLAAQIMRARSVAENGDISFVVDRMRVENVILKLARGHSAYELSEPLRERPSHIFFEPIMLLSDSSRQHFETPLLSAVWPEVGSRSMQRIVISGNGIEESGWLVVQPGRYRYFAHAQGAVMVRIVISEYLACEVIWSDDSSFRAI